MAGVNAMLTSGSEQDMKNAEEVIARVDQGGLGLPERDYYFKDDPKSVEIRKQYVAHMQRMFELLGNPAAKAAAMAKTVMDIETALAKGQLDVTSRREPEKVYHRMSVRELAALAPSIDWQAYLAGVGAPVQSLNVAVPEFFKTLESTLREFSLADWKTYLKWHVLRAAASLLPAAFVNESFAFYGKTLQARKSYGPGGSAASSSRR